MRKISSKLALLLALASLTPLLSFGVLSLTTSRGTASKLVVERNLKVAQRAAEEIAQYLKNSSRILKALASNINSTNLSPWQKESMLKDYVIEFEEFQAIHLIDADGRVLQTSSLRSQPEVQRDETLSAALKGRTPYRSGVFITDELIPTILLGFPAKERGTSDGMVLGIVNILDVWHVVDQIKVGRQGHAMVVSGKGSLLAHGDPKLKPMVIEQRVLDKHPLIRSASPGAQAPVIYRDSRGTSILSVGVPVPGTDWTLLVEQPSDEAFVDAKAMTRRLTIFIVVFTTLACGAGVVGGRRYVIDPVMRLISATRAFTRGAWDRRVEISSRDELGELGSAFNSMAENLELLKADIRRKERDATMGRVASGLVHDLKHPVKNIENMVGLIDRLFEDEEFRAAFKDTIKRELGVLNRYFADLADVAAVKPLQLVEVSLAPLLSALCDEFQISASSRRVEIVRSFPDEPCHVLADPHALQRVFSNLMNNALEAVPNGGIISVRISGPADKEGENPGSVHVQVEDTGPGITAAMRDKIFEPFVSTKRKGLGLGLSIAKKLTESHSGRIDLESSEGKGTTFTVTLPLANQ